VEVKKQMDDYEKQMTGYLIVTILAGLFLLIESMVIEAGFKLYIIVFIGIVLGATETYLVAILIHVFKIPRKLLSEETITIIPEAEIKPEIPEVKEDDPT